LDLNDLNFVHDSTAGTLWAPFKIYGASKLCNILFSKELSNKLERHGESYNNFFFLNILEMTLLVLQLLHKICSMSLSLLYLFLFGHNFSWSYIFTLL
jgi:hypothetical protein